ncbi:MAG TPA: alpha/beta hydrolase [Devosia sp.]|nr:alpha/beta hydrolase [Devosia sp.]
MTEAFASSFFTIVPDLPGIGDSIGTPAAAEKTVLADIVLKAAEELDAKDIVVAGFDVGGMIAFAAARDHGSRIRGAVVANTVLPGIDPWAKVISNPHIWHFAFHNIPDLPEILVTGHERQYFDFFTDFLAGKKEAVTEAHRIAFANAYGRPQALKVGFDWYRALEADAKTNMRRKQITTPVLYLRGDADGRGIEDYVAGLKAIGVETLAGKVIKGAGEFLSLEAPEAFVQVVRDFAKSTVSDDAA